MEKIKTRIALGGTCLLTSSFMTLLFYLAASRGAQYSATDISLGSIWVFVLSMIISAPLLIPLVRKRIATSTES